MAKVKTTLIGSKIISAGYLAEDSGETIEHSHKTTTFISLTAMETSDLTT